MSSTAQDLIAELVHRYSDAVTRRDEAAWSSCWADDPTWVVKPELTATGREEIVALLRRALASLDGVVQNVLHGTVSTEGSTGRGEWYLAEHYRRVTGDAGLLLARYDDTYVEQGGRWLFASRTLVPSYWGPPDLSGTFWTPPKKEDRTA